MMLQMRWWWLRSRALDAQAVRGGEMRSASGQDYTANGAVDRNTINNLGPTPSQRNHQAYRKCDVSDEVEQVQPRYILQAVYMQMRI